MVDIFHKQYLKQLASATDLYWEGDEKAAISMIKQAENDLESSIGKKNSDSFQNSLDGLLKKWRDLLLKSDFNTKPSHSQSIDFFQELRPPEDSFLTFDSDILLPDELLPEDELQQAFTLYKEDKIFESIQLLTSIKEKYQSNFNEFPLVAEIENDYRDIREIYNSVQDRNGWVKDHSGAITISYKRVIGTKAYSLLSEGLVDAPLFNFLSVIHETDLYNTWLPFCQKSFTIASLSKTRKIVFQEYKVPLVSPRHICMYGYGANLLTSDGVFIIVSKSCDQNPCFKEVKLPENLKSKRALVNIFGVILKPISLETTHVTLISNFDPMIKIVPSKLLKYFSKKLTKGIFKKAAKIAKNIEGTVYQERMQSPDNKEFYEYLRETQQEYLDSLKSVNR